LINVGYNPAILNLASAKHPCGGYAQGLSAQEESLCRSSNLSVSLFQYGDIKYKDVRESGIPTKGIGYPFDINYGGFTPDGEEIMLNKIRTIYRLGIEHGNDAIVTGALSCGAYKCPPQEVARLFRVVMEEPEFRNKFRLIVFTILEKSRVPHGLDGKYAPFYREFGTYVL
jgi:hypothetical protein